MKSKELDIRFVLLGHDSPLGYPASVVPVGILDGHDLVAIYANNDAAEVERLSSKERFVQHTKRIREQLSGFDHLAHRLFAFSSSSITMYEIALQHVFFRDLLKDSRHTNMNPFLRLSLAKASKDTSLIVQELVRCGEQLKTDPIFLEFWYSTQIISLSQHNVTTVMSSSLPREWESLPLHLAVIGDAEQRATAVNKLLRDKFLLVERECFDIRYNVAYSLISEIAYFVKGTLGHVEEPPSIRKMIRQYFQCLDSLEKYFRRSRVPRKASRTELVRLRGLHTKLFDKLAYQRIQIAFDPLAWDGIERVVRVFYEKDFFSLKTRRRDENTTRRTNDHKSYEEKRENEPKN